MATPSKNDRYGRTFVIDVHHHIFEKDFLDKEELNKTVGWRAPPENYPWSANTSLAFMDAVGIDFAFLSFPAIAVASPGPQNRQLTRKVNEYAAKICRDYPRRFGFFASLPTFDDVEGTLEEIEYCLDKLNADGFGIPSSFGIGSASKYVGADEYDPIWKEFDQRKAVVFLHGAQTPSSTPYPHDFLGLPVSEVPNETYKAASHLVVTGRKRKYPTVRIILAHLGGSTPFLAARVAGLSSYMGCHLTPEEIIEDFQTFYFDTALSGYETNLAAAESFVRPNRLLYGTDFPAVNKQTIAWYTENIKKYYVEDSEKLNSVLSGAAMNLFPKLRNLST